MALLDAEAALLAGEIEVAEQKLARIKSAKGSQPCHQHLETKMNALKPMYQATRDALAAENWELACEQAQLCAAAASHHGVPGLAVRVLLMQARAAGCSGEHQLALQALDHVLALQPHSVEALWQRAAVHAAAGQHQARFMDLRRLSNLQPSFPGVLHELQQASALCNCARQAAVKAAAPPQKTYIRNGRRSSETAAGGRNASLAIAAAYQQLGLSVTASEQDVRRAYKNLAIQLHPDKLVKASDADRAAAEDKFKAVAAAYSMLVN